MILSGAELEHLAKVITDEEHGTSGELRLMIVSRSSPVSHVRQSLFPILVLAGFVIAYMTGWSESHWSLLLIVVGALALAALLTRFELIQRWLTPEEDREECVWRRAELEFHREGLGNTKGRTGVLIFLSLMEHQAVVLGDKAIAEKLKPETWEEVVAKVLEGPRSGQWALKLEEAIRLCGKLLREHFPAGADNPNELENHVIVKI